MLESFGWARTARRAAFVVALTVCLSAVFLFGNNGEKKVFRDEDIAEDIMEYNDGCGIYIDDTFVAACDSVYTASDVINGLCDDLAQIYGAPMGEHSIYNDVRYISGKYEKAAFVDGARLACLLGFNGGVFDFSVKDVFGTDTGIKLMIVTVVSDTLTETVPRHIDYVETDLLLPGEVITVAEGRDGTAENSYLYTYMNGVLTEAVVTSSVTVTEAVSAEVWQGSDSGATLMDSNELFMLPYDGRVTSWYGYRYLWDSLNYHNGIDLAGLNGGCYGEPIYAAADGIVSFADWNGGYGRKIVIDHSDSVSTVYAHCSKLLVEEGQAVQKGELIALIGNSGKVTGAHLHFEVLIDGVKCDPEPYLDWSTYRGTLN